MISLVPGFRGSTESLIRWRAIGPQRNEISGWTFMVESAPRLLEIFSVAGPVKTRPSTDFRRASSSVIMPSREYMEASSPAARSAMAFPLGPAAVLASSHASVHTSMVCE